MFGPNIIGLGNSGWDGPISEFAMNLDSPQARGLRFWAPVTPEDGAAEGGTFYDNTGRKAVGVITGAGVEIRQGIMGPYAAAPSTSSAITLDQEKLVLPTDLRYSFSAWVKRVQHNSQAYSIGLGRWGGGNWFEGIRLGAISGANQRQVELRSIFGSTIGAITLASPAYTADEWFHIAAVFSGDAHRELYVNGISKGTETTSVPNRDGLNTLQIGGQGNSTTGGIRWEVRDGRGAYVAWNADEVWQQYDPATRYDLFYELGRRTYSIAAVGGGTNQDADISAGVTASAGFAAHAAAQGALTASVTLSATQAATAAARGDFAAGAACGSAASAMATAVAALAAAVGAGETWSASAAAAAEFAAGTEAGAVFSSGSTFTGDITAGVGTGATWLGATVIQGAMSAGTELSATFLAGAQAFAAFSAGVTAEDVAQAVAHAFADLSAGVTVGEAMTATVTLFGVGGALFAEVRITPALRSSIEMSGALKTIVRVTPALRGRITLN